MKEKSSIRYYLGKEVRAFFDYSNNTWYYAATDIVGIIANTKDPRRYWNTIKRRNAILKNSCRQYKLFANDGKKYLTDTLDFATIKVLATIIPSIHNEKLQEWLMGGLDPIDEQSKRRAYELFDNKIIDEGEIGTSISLQKIHAYLFEGLYDFAGKIRRITISKGDFVFANGDFLPETLKEIDKMPEGTFEEIIKKYVEMNVAHPFLEGNGRSTRIWLDLILKKELGKCIDWDKVDKQEYLMAMRISPYDSKQIHDLLEKAVTEDISNHEIFMKGIDSSYYYETIEDE